MENEKKIRSSVIIAAVGFCLVSIFTSLFADSTHPAQCDKPKEGVPISVLVGVPDPYKVRPRAEPSVHLQDVISVKLGEIKNHSFVDPNWGGGTPEFAVELFVTGTNGKGEKSETRIYKSDTKEKPVLLDVGETKKMGDVSKNSMKNITLKEILDANKNILHPQLLLRVIERGEGHFAKDTKVLESLIPLANIVDNITETTLEGADQGMSLKIQTLKIPHYIWEDNDKLLDFHRNRIAEFVKAQRAYKSVEKLQEDQLIESRLFQKK